jgi:hypothetical protein
VISCDRCDHDGRGTGRTQALFQVGPDERGVHSLGEHRLITHRHRFRLELEPGVSLVEEVPLGVGVWLEVSDVDDRRVRGSPGCEQAGDVPLRGGVVARSPIRIVERLHHVDEHERRFHPGLHT